MGKRLGFDWVSGGVGFIEDHEIGHRIFSRKPPDQFELVLPSKRRRDFVKQEVLANVWALAKSVNPIDRFASALAFSVANDYHEYLNGMLRDAPKTTKVIEGNEPEQAYGKILRLHLGDAAAAPDLSKEEFEKFEEKGRRRFLGILPSIRSGKISYDSLARKIGGNLWLIYG
jgi:hypothetical protein